MNTKIMYHSNLSVISSLGKNSSDTRLVPYTDTYHGSVISSAIHVQLRELEAAVDPSFDIITKTSWSSLANVSGPSSYVAELVKAIEHVVELINPLVEQKKYLRNFYDKAAR